MQYFNPLYSFSDYPFGMLMPGRNSDSTYRFGFNGKENLDEVKGKAKFQDFGARLYDNRIGRFLSVDAMFSKYPELNPYCFVGNMPNISVDLDGNEIFFVNSNGNLINATSTLIKTKTGAALYAKFANSKNADIYIGVSNFGNSNSAVGLTVPQANMNINKTGIRVNDNARITIDIKVEQESKNAFSVFNKTDFSKSKGRVIHLISIDEKALGNYNSYEMAEAIFHEIKAHVDINSGDGDADHKLYGKSKVGLYYELPLYDDLGNPQLDENNNSKKEIVPKNSPAFKIVTELKDNQVKDKSNEKPK